MFVFPYAREGKFHFPTVLPIKPFKAFSTVFIRLLRRFLVSLHPNFKRKIYHG